MKRNLLKGLLPLFIGVGVQSTYAADCQIPKRLLDQTSESKHQKMASLGGFDCPIEPPIEPPGGGTGGTTYSGVSIYQDTSGTFDKPVILVEGFDPLNLNSARDLYHRMPYSLKSNLRNSGRDVVVVSFNDGGASLRTNANKLKTLINWVNDRKQGNHSNAVFGLSMGGVVSRIALKEMENSGIDHETGVYVSFDSPHRGAYVPGDIKHTLNRMLDKISKYVPSSSLKNEVKASLRDSLRLVDSPAAREMLVTSGYSNSFYNYLDNLGYPDDAVRVAYSMGSATGTDNGHSRYPSTNLMHFRLEVYQIKNYYFDINIGGCYRPCDVLNGHYANSPGSTLNPVNTLDSEMSGSGGASIIDYDLYDIDRRDTGFIPVYSALDMKHIDLSKPYTSSMKKHSPFDVIDVVSSQNLRHDENGILNAISWRTNSLIDVLNNYHVYSPNIPSRSDKVAPLNSVSSAQSEWLVGGTNFVQWSSVPGATHYQVFIGGSFYPVKTVSNTRTSVSVMSNTQVKVRACNADMCSYPASTPVYYRPDLDPF